MMVYWFQEGTIEYTVIKADPTQPDVKVQVTLTSAPIPGTQPIVFKHQMRNSIVQFTSDTEVMHLIGFATSFSSIPMDTKTVEKLIR